jgi:hypothetical protein
MADEKAGTRDERLKAALRANLRKRKAQERGRTEADRPAGKRDEEPQGGSESGPTPFPQSAQSGPDSDKTGL